MTSTASGIVNRPADSTAPATARQRLAAGMAELVGPAVARGLDPAPLLEAIEALWPDWHFRRALHAAALYTADRHREALAIVAPGTNTSDSALRAACLWRLGDPTWFLHAKEVIERGDCPRSTALVRRLALNASVDLGVASTSPTSTSPTVASQTSGIRA